MSAKCQKRTFVPPVLPIARLCSPGIFDICAFCLDPFAARSEKAVVCCVVSLATSV